MYNIFLRINDNEKVVYNIKVMASTFSSSLYDQNCYNKLYLIKYNEHFGFLKISSQSTNIIYSCIIHDSWFFIYFIFHTMSKEYLKFRNSKYQTSIHII